MDSSDLVEPIILRSTGRLTLDNDTQLNLEFNRNLNGQPSVTSVHGIMKSCIVRIFDLGRLPEEFA